MNSQLSMPRKIPAVLESTACLLLLVTVLMGAEGCARRPVLPDQSTIPSGQQLPLDGLWRLTSGNTGSIFRIDKGRMYFYERRKPLPINVLPIGATAKNPRILSAADLSFSPGEIIAMDIKETSGPRDFSCQSLSYDAEKDMLGFGFAEIRIVSSAQIILKTFPNLGTGLGEKIEEGFWRENLDNQSWFEQILLKPDDRGSQPGKNPQEIVGQTDKGFNVQVEQPNQDSQVKVEQPNQDSKEHVEQPALSSEDSKVIEKQSSENATEGRKVIAVPPEKMESNGKLSKSAKEFIGQVVQNAKKANGSVEINCPPDAPDAIVKSLVNIGAETYVDDNRNDYELVITKP
jgi:hypothetical protein